MTTILAVIAHIGEPAGNEDMCLLNEKYNAEDLDLFRKELRESNLRIVGLTGSIGIQNMHRKTLYAGAGWNDLMRWWWPNYQGLQ